MHTNSIQLLERSITDLQQLAIEFAAELERARPLPGKTLQHLRKKETLLAISVLLPKLAAVRRLDPAPLSGTAAITPVER
jgi:hypothetical protein